jgi:hypothetical protein
MLRRSTQALTLALLLAPVAAACTPAPSASGSAGTGADPSEAQPEQLCKHVRELADADTDDAAVLDQVERDCVETLTGMQTRYQTFTTCVAAASDAKSLAECEQPLDRPRALLAAVGPGAKVEAVCDHVITMLDKELGQESQMDATQLEQLRTQCVTDATKQVEAKGQAAFEAEADCILAASNLQGLQACGM